MVRARGIKHARHVPLRVDRDERDVDPGRLAAHRVEGAPEVAEGGRADVRAGRVAEVDEQHVPRRRAKVERDLGASGVDLRQREARHRRPIASTATAIAGSSSAAVTDT